MGVVARVHIRYHRALFWTTGQGAALAGTAEGSVFKLLQVLKVVSVFGDDRLLFLGEGLPASSFWAGIAGTESGPQPVDTSPAKARIRAQNRTEQVCSRVATVLRGALVAAGARPVSSVRLPAAPGLPAIMPGLLATLSPSSRALCTPKLSCLLLLGGLAGAVIFDGRAQSICG